MTRNVGNCAMVIALRSAPSGKGHCPKCMVVSRFRFLFSNRQVFLRNIWPKKRKKEKKCIDLFSEKRTAQKLLSKDQGKLKPAAVV